MRVALLGLGLIGGSLARALHAAGWRVQAWTPGGAGPRAALAAGVIEAAAPSLEAAVQDADLVVLAAPPSACLGLLVDLARSSHVARARGPVITDVASTKVLLVEQAARLGLRFVGGHPMAGREASGFDAAEADLFLGRPWVVVPSDPADEEAIAAVEALAASCGAVPVRMTAADHDAAVAAISHTPLVLAAALVEAMAGGPGEREAAGWLAAARLAASGWAGATRLARGDPAMGAGIARTNAGPLAADLRGVRDRLDEWLALLEAGGPDGLPDEAALHARFAAARARLEGAG